MHKLINDPADVVTDALRGVAAAEGQARPGEDLTHPWLNRPTIVGVCWAESSRGPPGMAL